MQSYKSKLPEVRCELQPLYGFDVLAMCETWLTANVPDRLISVDGYRLFRRDRPVSMSLPRGHGGVAILVSDSFECQLVPTPNTNVPDSNLEIVWVSVKINSGLTLMIASAYRVPVTSAAQLLADFDDLKASFSSYLQCIRERNSLLPVILTAV